MGKENNKKVKIYSTHQCPFCIQAKKFMDEYKIAYINHFVDDNDNFREEMIKKSGQLGVPVLIIDDKIFTGFGTNTQKELFKLVGK